MRKRKKRTSGSSLARLAPAFALLIAGALIAAPAPKSKKTEPFALIAGSVFRDTGFALAGAEVEVDAVTEGKPPSKSKRIKAITDARGEFAIRVPPVPMRYTVSVKAARYTPESKAVSIQGEERVDLYFRLEPESK